MSVNPTPLRVVSALTSKDAHNPGSAADDVGTSEMTENVFGSDGMLTGRARPCHAVAQPYGHAVITKSGARPNVRRAAAVPAPSAVTRILPPRDEVGHRRVLDLVLGQEDDVLRRHGPYDDRLAAAGVALDVLTSPVRIVGT